MHYHFFTLPDGFGIGDNDTLVHFYSAGKSSANNKVVFTKNMFGLVLQGVKQVQTTANKITATAADVLMLTAGSTLMSETVTADKKYEAILIFFGNKTLSRFCANNKLTIGKKATSRLVYKVPKDDFLDNYCRSLQLLQKENTPAIYELKVQEILGYISAKHPETFKQFATQALGNNSDIELQQVVEANTDKNLSIEELAFLCSMSVSTFKRHFAEVYKVSPKRYFTQLKMEEAKMLLSLHKRPTEIYRDLGYENLSAFSNEFKKHFGVSPGQYKGKNELPAQVIELSE